MPIYKIVNSVNGEIYVGKTELSIDQRFIDHAYASRYYDTHLYRAFKKYGVDAFTIQLIEDCDLDALSEREMYWIQELRPHYNMTAGGTGGPTHHLQSWKDGMARRRSYVGEGNPQYGKESAFAGKQHSAESIERMSAARSAHWDALSVEQRAARGDKVSGQNNGMFGKTPKNAIQYEYAGVTYNSLSDACKSTGRSSDFIKKHGKRVI